MKLQTAGALLVLYASLMGAPAIAATPQQIASGFVDGVEVCLKAELAGSTLGAMPDLAGGKISKADESARFLAGPRNPNGPIWDVLSAKGNVLISEPAPGECEVISYGPPVDPTLKQAIAKIKSEDPSVKDAGDAPDAYTPIRYGLADTMDGANLHIILSGAEPGTVPGRTFRFSTLNARFVRQDQSATQ